MEREPARTYLIGRYRLDLARRCLVGDDGKVVALSTRGYDVLAHLLEHRHRVVSKDELMKAVWPKVIVEENNLTQAISHARRALGDTRESPQFIATVAGRGYQFVGDVVSLDDGVAAPVASPSVDPATTAIAPVAPPAAGPMPGRRALLLGLGAVAAVAVTAWLRGRSAAPDIESIAVLPFKPLAGSTRDRAIEVGVAELLINRLSSHEAIVVRPLSSVIAFAGPTQDPLAAGRSLAVDAVVDGYVQIRDERIRITARLLDTRDGRALWSGSFTEPMRDIFSVQDALAIRIASAVSAVGPAAKQDAWVGYGTRDAVAWQIYASGQFALQRRDADALRRALELFEAAQRRDPSFALALVGAADALTLLAVFGVEPTAPALSRARAFALQALSADPALPEAHAALGHVLTQYDRDFAGGRRQYYRALELRADHAFSHAMLALNLAQSGRSQAALRHIRQAQTLEPAALHYSALEGFVRSFARQPAQAEESLAKLVELAPGAILPRQFLARVLLARRESARVISLLEGHNDPAPSSMSNLGRAYAQSGRMADARAEFVRVERLGQAGIGVGYDLALLHLELGDRDAALAALERAVADHSQMLGFLNVDPTLDPLRGDPRFIAVARQLDFG